MFHPELRRLVRPLVVVGFAALITGCGDGARQPSPSIASKGEAFAFTTPTLTPQVSGTTSRLDSVAAVNERVVWASGRAGTVVRTTDGGATWEVHVIPGAETLAFRDIHAVNEDVAFVLTNNGGLNARIYKTEDGGQTWTPETNGPTHVELT